MSTITDLGATDPGDTSRGVINTNFSNLNTDKAEKADIQKDSYNYAADTGVADAYVVTLTPVPAVYATGMRVVFKAANTNTGASTLNVNSLGLKTIKKLVTQDLAAGDITQNAIVSVVYDGTYFQIEGIVPGVVYTSGDQTIAGVKTFSSIPVLPASNPTANNEAVRKLYVEEKVGLGSLYFPSYLKIDADLGWTISADIIIYYANGIYINKSIAPRAPQAVSSSLTGKTDSHGALNWNSGIDLTVAFMGICSISVGGGNYIRSFFGLSTTTDHADILGDITNVTRRVGFAHNGGKIYAICANGTNVSAVEIVGTDSQLKRKYSIEFTTSAVKFYIDGELLTTITTYIPNDANVIYFNFSEFSSAVGAREITLSDVVMFETII